MAGATRFIDKLKKAARLDPVKKEIVLDNGDEVVMYVTPLTAAERERARRTPAPMTLVRLRSSRCIRKAKNGNGQPLHPQRRRHPEERSSTPTFKS